MDIEMENQLQLKVVTKRNHSNQLRCGLAWYCNVWRPFSSRTGFNYHLTYRPILPICLLCRYLRCAA